MNLHIQTVPIENKSELFDLLQEHLANFSQYSPIAKNASGHFDYPYWEQYWTEKERIPLMISLKETIIGFALINDFVVDKTFKANLSIAEFYIRPDYRRQGYGKQFVFWIFNQYPSKWEIRQVAQDLTARLFWNRVINEYTSGAFREVNIEYNGLKMVVQLFEVRKV